MVDGFAGRECLQSAWTCNRLVSRRPWWALVRHPCVAMPVRLPLVKRTEIQLRTIPRLPGCSGSVSARIGERSAQQESNRTKRRAATACRANLFQTRFPTELPRRRLLVLPTLAHARFGGFNSSVAISSGDSRVRSRVRSRNSTNENTRCFNCEVVRTPKPG